MEVMSIDNLIQSFDPEKDYSPKATDSSYITIRVPLEKKEKFEHLQAVTKKRFGKLLKTVITNTIDSIEID